MRSITAADAGKQVALSVDESCQVVLAGNPTTGFQWEVTRLDTAVVKQVGAATYEPSGTAMGSGGQFTFQLQAVAPGQTLLKLIYHRSFEKGTPPAQIYEVTLTVR
jgi:inhibitor of cysteine peptidase